MTAIETLISVLCGPDGKCCISGSADDRRLIDSALADIAQAAQSADSVQEDAARYRGLRNKSRVLYNQAWFGGMSVRNHYVDFLCRDDALAALDKAIDAERAAQKEGEKP